MNKKRDKEMREPAMKNENIQRRLHDVTDEVYQREGLQKVCSSVVGCMATKNTMFEALLNTAAFRSRLLSIRIFGSTHWSPN